MLWSESLILQMAERNAIDASSITVDERAIAQAVLSERNGVMYQILTTLGINPAQLSEQILSSDAHALLERTPSVNASPDADFAASPEVPSPDVSTHDSMNAKEHQQQLTIALAQVTLPPWITIRAWTTPDFPTIQQISSSEGWTSPLQRPADLLLAWQQSWPALVAVIIGFVRGLTDGAMTMYIAEMAVDARQRGHGIGRALLDVCHHLYPTTRLDLLAVDDVCTFYEACGFKVIHDGMRKSYV
jgi:GNAT superfamily N-acetyltransferase